VPPRPACPAATSKASATFHALFREVYEAVLAGVPPANPTYATFEDGHYEMLVGDAVARSARAGRWIEVAEA
jgi:predicted dehydrogenase